MLFCLALRDKVPFSTTEIQQDCKLRYRYSNIICGADTKM
jgi:hypothetical protein